MSAASSVAEDPVSHNFERWNAFTGLLKRPILRAVQKAAVFSVEWPITVIIATFLFSFGIVGLGVATNFRVENDGSVLWVPTGCITQQHGDWIFSADSGFPEPTRTIQMMVHANGANILDLDLMTRFFQAVDTVLQTPGYTDLCAPDTVGGECPILSPTGFWANHSLNLFLETVGTEEDLVEELSRLRFANQEPVNRNIIYGQPTPSLPEDAFSSNTTTLDSLRLESVTAYLITIALPSALEEEALAFEAEMTDRLFALEGKWNREEGNLLVIETITDRSFDDELLRGIQGDIPLMAAAFLIMGCFVAFVLSKKHPVESQSILGIGAVTTVFLAIATGYGLNFCTGVPFSSLTQIFPYVMVGIGLDDTFIITGAFARADPSLDMATRIEKVMGEVGVSISVSTLTTFVAFMLGGLSSLPGLRWFAWYAGPTVAIDFVYQITFFVAILAIDDRRKKANRRDCCPCCLATAKPEEDSTGLTNTQNVPQTDNEELEMATNANGDEQQQQEEVSFGSRLVETYANALLRPTSKLAVFIVFGTMLGLGAWQASQQTQEFDWRSLVPPDSFVKDFFGALDEYFGQQANVDYVSAFYFRDVDVSVVENQEAMMAFVDDMTSTQYVGLPPQNFWLSDFLSFAETEDAAQNLTFYESLDVFLSVEPYNRLYRDDVVRDENKIVTASRAYFVFYGVNPYDNEEQIDALEVQQDVTRRQPFNAGVNSADWDFFTYGRIYYAWELYAVIAFEIVLNVCLGLGAVFLIALVFLPHPFGALIVTPVVAVIYVELLGLLYVADIYVNSVSAVGLTMSIGIVVDYNMHIILSYFEVHGAATRNDRVKQVLHTMGKSIMLGGFSTFLGVVPLCLSSSEVFRTFFVTFIGIVLFGTFHGLVFIPVILSLIAPHEPSSPELTATEDDSPKK